MRDDFLTRDWSETHGNMSDGIAGLFKTIAAGLTRLNARQFDAPWHNERGTHRTNSGQCG